VAEATLGEATLREDHPVWEATSVAEATLGEATLREDHPVV
jgi:hypothetical protein